MSERLARLEARIATTRQLASLIGAMRAVAAAHVREAQSRVESVRAYAGTVGSAIADALSLSVPAGNHDGPRGGSRLAIALCAEQGFAGAYSERILERVAAFEDREPVLFVIGSRGAVVAEEGGVRYAWFSPMVARAEQAAMLAERIARQVYARLLEGGIGEVAVVHGVPEGPGGYAVISRRLFPLDYSRFRARVNPHPPLATLPPDTLIARLAEEYVFAALCEAIMLSFAAENEARMHAMISARNNVERRLEELVNESRQARQAEITAEIIELAAGRRSSS